MSTSKRKISAKPFVNDLRNGMGDRELMKKYTLSESQLHKVFQKLVDAGVLDEMELFMRTTLSDSTISKAFVETQRSVQELDNLEEIRPPRNLKTPTEIEITERLTSTRGVSKRMVSKLGRTGS